MPTPNPSSCLSSGTGPELRLRAVHPLVEPDGSCALLYDLERTFILDVPAPFRRSIATMLESRSFGGGIAEWLRAEDLVTGDPYVSWAEPNPEPRTPDPEPGTWNRTRNKNQEPGTRNRERTLPLVTDISLDLSGSCNLGCVYCFEKDIDSRIGPMSDETALAALDFTFRRAQGAPRVAVHFGSGEPLVRFDLIRRIVEEASRRAAEAGQAIAFELTTNATLVTPEIAGFLRDHPFNVRVSCDGPPAVQNRLRPFLGGQGSYAAVERGLRVLAEAIPARLTVNSVLAGGNRLRDLWGWAKAMRLRRYHVIKVGAFAADAINLAAQELQDFRDDLQSICDDLFAALESGATPIDYQPITKIVRRLMIPEPITRFCGVAGSYLGVASNGEVYPCFRHLGVPHYHLGNVTSGVSDAKRLLFITREAADVDNRPVCQDCWARYMCGGGCYADSTVYGPDAAKPQVQHCPFWRTEIELAIRFYKRLLAADPRHCLTLFGDDPDALLARADSGPTFLERRNCQ